MDVVDAAHQGGQDAGIHAEVSSAGRPQPARRQTRAVAPRAPRPVREDAPRRVREDAPRRVREDVRDGVAVIAFSAVMSLVMAITLMLLTRLVD
jgi:hypothetical protein